MKTEMEKCLAGEFIRKTKKTNCIVLFVEVLN